MVGGPILLGRLVRARVRLNQALADKAVAAEDDREARAAGAVAAERARIAGELHHLVSDALAAMVAEATTAEQLVSTEPDVAGRAFGAVEDTGREALREIRALLGVLRREDEELAFAPQPSLAHVAELVARVRAAGLPVELDVGGEHMPLPAGVDLTAYRVVQEALAGALHAPGERTAAVRLRYTDGELGVEVTDAGKAPPDGARALLGMQERVALYGGEMVAEPLDDSGYAVRVRLPWRPHDPPAHVRHPAHGGGPRDVGDRVTALQRRQHAVGPRAAVRRDEPPAAGPAHPPRGDDPGASPARAPDGRVRDRSVRADLDVLPAADPRLRAEAPTRRCAGARSCSW